MKVNVTSLIGPALDWAVAKCGGTPGLHIIQKPGKTCVYGVLKMPSGEMIDWPVQPSTDWSQGGPILDLEEITIDYRDNETQARKWSNEKNTFITANAGKRQGLIAAMRCYCCAKLGEEIEIPDELMRKD